MNAVLRLLITGSEGLVGTALCAALERDGHQVVGLDLRGSEPCDVRDAAAVRARAEGCDGVVHLAALSRVVWAQNDPERCWSTNVEGTRNVLGSTGSAWFLFASSREVYGEPESSPTPESTPVRPLNVYGRSKVAGEELTLGARGSGRVTAVVRLSNVYGVTADHADRVVPAFARAALEGTDLRVDGRDNVFDFVHLDDAIDGLMRMITRLAAGQALPTLHLVTGSGTSLGELADLAVACADSGSRSYEAPARTFDVSRFCGDPGLAEREIGWRARTDIATGMAKLVEAFRRSGPGLTPR